MSTPETAAPPPVETATPAPAPAATPEAPAEAAPAAPETPAEPEKPDLSQIASEVMKRRDASQLQALVREKRQLEAEKTKLKEVEPKAQKWAKLEQLIDDDPAAAIEYMMAERAGDPARAKAILATAYDGLTQRILGVESKSTPATARVERSVSRLEQELQTLKSEKAQAEARLAEREANEHEQRVQSAVQQVSQYLSSTESEYPYLAAEADAPEDVVWGILSEAHEKGIDLTLAEAAGLANDHFKPAFEKKKERYAKHLLAPEKGRDTPSKPETTKSPNGTSRKSLTNADASQVTPPTQLPPPKTDQERLDRAFAVLRKGHGLNG